MVTPMVTIATIAEIGALVGDPARANMLTALLDGRALTARELAELAGVTPQTASGHLAKLMASGLICMEVQGRRHYHRLASAEVAQMLEAMHVAGAGLKPQGPARRIGPADPAMRVARTCYDHLAGALAVGIADALSEDGAPFASACSLSCQGEARLAAWGIDLEAARKGRKVFCRPCLDWSERRPHLAGALGVEILNRSIELGWLRRRFGRRELIITPIGRQGFREQFGVTLEA